MTKIKFTKKKAEMRKKTDVNIDVEIEPITFDTTILVKKKVCILIIFFLTS